MCPFLFMSCEYMSILVLVTSMYDVCSVFLQVDVPSILLKSHFPRTGFANSGDKPAIFYFRQAA